MPIYDIYSKRLRKMNGDVPEVYVYDDLPNPLRVQIVQIWTECLGNPNATLSGSSKPGQLTKATKKQSKSCSVNMVSMNYLLGT